MSTVISEHYQRKYSTNWEHLAQQTVARFEQYCLMDSFDGKEKSYNQVKPTTMREITTRMGRTDLREQEYELRWLRLKAFADAKGFDEFDDKLLGDITRPTSETIQAQKFAFYRMCDQILFDGLIGTAYTGEDGVDPIDLPNDQKVPVGYVYTGAVANSGMTTAKIKRAAHILGVNEEYGQDVDFDSMSGICLALSQQQITDLVHQEEIINGDYLDDIRALRDGRVHRFMGFDIKRSELLPKDLGTDIRSCIAWTKSSVRMGKNPGFSTRMSIRDDLNETLQIRSKGRVGAARVRETGVVEILCDESP